MLRSAAALIPLAAKTVIIRTVNLDSISNYNLEFVSQIMLLKLKRTACVAVVLLIVLSAANVLTVKSSMMNNLLTSSTTDLEATNVPAQATVHPVETPVKDSTVKAKGKTKVAPASTTAVKITPPKSKSGSAAGPGVKVTIKPANKGSSQSTIKTTTKTIKNGKTVKIVKTKNTTKSTKPKADNKNSKTVVVKVKNASKVTVQTKGNQTKIGVKGKVGPKHPSIRKMVVVGPDGKKYVKIIDEDSERHKKLLNRIKELESSLDKANKRMLLLKDENFNEIIQYQLGSMLNKIQYKGGVTIKVKRPPPKDPIDFRGEMQHRTESKKIQRKRINQIITNGNVKTKRKTANLDSIVKKTSSMNIHNFGAKAFEDKSKATPAVSKSATIKPLPLATQVKPISPAGIKNGKITSKVTAKSDGKDENKKVTLTKKARRELKPPEIKFERHSGRRIRRLSRRKAKEAARNRKARDAEIQRKKSIESLALKI